MDLAAIDYRPLTEPVPPGAISAFRTWARSTHQPWAASAAAGRVLGLITAVLFGVVVIAMVAVAGAIVSMSATAFGWDPFAGTPVLVLLVAAVLLAVFAVRRARPFGGWEQKYRFYHFAALNGMEWYSRIENPGYPGLLFARGTGGAAYSGARATSGRALDIGNFTYTTGTGDDRTVHHAGFMALRLDRRIPHCVIDARANNSVFGASSLAPFAKDQVLRLEGDFNEHFTLYCPRGYEADALYIFTPDLMALLIDHSSAFDVEIVDDWLFVYSNSPWNTADPAAWARLFSIADTVGRKTVSQTERYRDERSPALPAPAFAAELGHGDNVVAPQGRRLTRRLPVGLIVAFVGVPLLVVAVFGIGLVNAWSVIWR